MSLSETRAILEILTKCHEPTVLATLVDVQGSSYRRAGARLLITRENGHAGSISGGCLEEDLFERAKRVFSEGKPQIAVYDTTGENDLIWGVGLGCHGVVTVLLELLPVSPKWAVVLASNVGERRPTDLAVVWDSRAPELLGTCLSADLPKATTGLSVFRQNIAAPLHLVICGAGADAPPLVQLAHEMGWVTTVCDSRPGRANPARFPTAGSCVCCPPTEILSHVPFDEETVVVIMTHRYAEDVPLLRSLLPLSLSYIGLLGPQKRAEMILVDLEAEGTVVTEAARQSLHGPVGLDIGADGAEEVALSILAEIKARLSGREGRSLRERQGAIHDRAPR